MKELTTDQLKEILNTQEIRGTPEQVRLLAVRVNELCHLNGRDWVAANSDQLLDQWDKILLSMAAE